MRPFTLATVSLGETSHSLRTSPFCSQILIRGLVPKRRGGPGRERAPRALWDRLRGEAPGRLLGPPEESLPREDRRQGSGHHLEGIGPRGRPSLPAPRPPPPLSDLVCRAPTIAAAAPTEPLSSPSPDRFLSIRTFGLLEFARLWESSPRPQRAPTYLSRASDAPEWVPPAPCGPSARAEVYIDWGSGYTKVGLSGDAEPRFVVPSAVSQAAPEAEFQSGSSAFQNGVEIHWPLRLGRVCEKESLQYLATHLYDQCLGVSPEEYPVVATEPLLPNGAHREALAELMLEYFGVPELSLYPQPLLSLLAAGFTSGSVVEVGSDLTQIAVVSEGCLTLQRVHGPLGGRRGTELLQEQLLYRLYHGLDENAYFSSLEAMKSLYSFCEPSASSSSSSGSRLLTSVPSGVPGERHFALPDGRQVTLESERSLMMEYLFSGAGVPQRVVEALGACDKGLHRTALESMILSGGPTQSAGFPQRLDAELRAALPASTPLCLRAPDRRQTLCWRGIAAAETLLQGCGGLSRREYEEVGPSAIHRYCVSLDEGDALSVE